LETDEDGEDEEDIARLHELTDLAETNYYTQKQQQEEDAFLSQAADDLEASYFKQKATRAKEGEPSHWNSFAR